MLQIQDDVVRFIHPLHLTLRTGDAQARRLDLTAALLQGFAMFGVVLRIAPDTFVLNIRRNARWLLRPAVLSAIHGIPDAILRDICSS